MKNKRREEVTSSVLDETPPLNSRNKLEARSITRDGRDKEIETHGAASPGGADNSSRGVARRRKINLTDLEAGVL